MNDEKLSNELERILLESGLFSGGKCLSCDVCCRFSEATTAFAPFFSENECSRAIDCGFGEDAFLQGRYGTGQAALLKKDGERFICPGFSPESNGCLIYRKRPLDCRLYPFMLTYSPAGDAIHLGVDPYCPAVADAGAEILLNAGGAIASAIEREGAQLLLQCGVVGEWKEHLQQVTVLPTVGKVLCRSDLGLCRLTASACSGLAKYFEQFGSGLFHHSLAATYMWGEVFNIYYRQEDERLLLIAEAEGDAFLMLPPIGSGDALAPAEKGLEILRQMNPRGVSPRIQEAGDSDLSALAAGNWRVRESNVEYVYLRDEMAELKGNRFEKKRQMCNRFSRDNKWSWRAFDAGDFPAVVSLYRKWLKARQVRNELLFVAQAEASLRALCRLVKTMPGFDVVARVLETSRGIAGFTAGSRLHDGRSFSVFCDSFEELRKE